MDALTEMDTLKGFLATMFGLSNGNALDPSIATLLLTSALAIFGTVLKWLWDFVNAVITERQKRRRTLVDLIIFMHFLDDSIKPYVEPIMNGEKEPQWLREFEKMIKAENEKFRPFIVVVNESTALTDIQAIRHQFRPRDIARIDAYVAQAMLFHRYFMALGSDEFVELSEKRKLAAAKTLCKVGRATMAASETVRRNVLEIKDLARDLPLQQIFGSGDTFQQAPNDGDTVRQSGAKGQASVEHPQYGDALTEK